MLANTQGRRGIVLQLDADGQPTAYAVSDVANNYSFQQATLVSDETGVWLLSRFWPEGFDRPKVWSNASRFRE